MGDNKVGMTYVEYGRCQVCRQWDHPLQLTDICIGCLGTIDDALTWTTEPPEGQFADTSDGYYAEWWGGKLYLHNVIADTWLGPLPEVPE